MSFAGPHDAAALETHQSAKRILVLFEPGRAGVAAVELAREIAQSEQATVTVVAVAPQAPASRGCIISAADYNAAVRDAVAADLERVEEMLWCIGPRADCRALIERTDPSLEEYVTTEGFDLVLLPGHRRPLRSIKHPAAGAVARAGAEVRIVAAP